MPATGPAPPQPALALARTLAEATSVEAALAGVLRLIGETFDWSAVNAWQLDPATGLLRWTQGWTLPDQGLVELREVSRRLTFAPGLGLPGRVVQSGEIVWIEDVQAERDLPRHAAVSAAGLRSAAGVPIAGSAGVLGVIEMFSPRRRALDGDELESLRLVGLQVGEYLARTVVEEQLRATEESSAAIVRAALDCIITMDHRGVVLDFNPAAEATFGYSRDDAVGRALGDLIVPPELREAHFAAVARYVSTRVPRILDQRLELTGMRSDGSTFPCELTVSRLGDREPPMFAGFIRDITQRRRAEEELAALLERQQAARVRAEQAELATRRVSEALQRSLLPPHLPEIPGIDLGAAYRAGGEGLAVGGDFYDVFELSENRWGIVIGDVRGKGADAASITALARYTIRTAAVREDSPSAVLHVLNDALLRHAPEDDFCTAIYACLAVADGTPRLTVAVGGHPMPLLLCGGGGIASAGVPGTLLGAMPAPRLTDTVVELAPGDLLLLYTDGVTESRTPDGFFGVERLVDLLAGRGGRSAASVARDIEQAVSGSPDHQPLDDVAVLALRRTP